MTGDSSDAPTVTGYVDGVSAGKRIALCGLFRRGGGASRVIQQQATELTDAGYNVTIVALEADLDPPDDVNLLVVNIFQDTTYLSRLYWLFFPLLPVFPYVVAKLCAFDTVIVHRYPFTVAGRVASRLSDATYVYWSHPSSDPAAGFEGLARYWVRLINRFEIRGPGVASADHIVSVSDASGKHLSRYIDRPITIVPNVVNAARFPDDPPTAEIRSEYGIDLTKPVVLYVGRITRKKDLVRLIDMFDAATTDGPAATLVLTGKIPQAAYEQRLQKHAGDNVVFTGYVSDAALAALYEVGDVFATCSLEEGWGLPISEATYFGLTVVAFDSHPAAIAEDASYLIPEGDYGGFVAAIEDAIRSSKPSI